MTDTTATDTTATDTDTDTDTGTAPNTEPDTTPAAEAETTDDGDTTTTRAERRQHRDDERYRERLRTVEAQRDVLADRVAAMQRAEAERLAAQHLRDGRDLWAGGVTMDSLLDENGDLVPKLVTDAARDVRAARPHWGYSPAAPTSTVTADDKPTDTTEPSFTDAFRPRIG